MPKKKRNGTDESLADLAKQGLERIIELSKSQLISEKLQSINILMFVLIATVNLTFFLGGSTMNGFSLVVIAVFCFVLSLIGVLGYGPIITVISNFSGNKVEPLRAGIMLLFVSLTFGVSALVFNSDLLAKISVGLIGLQIVAMPIDSLFVSNVSVENKIVSASQVWDALGKIASLTGIIGFIIDVILLLVMA